MGKVYLCAQGCIDGLYAYDQESLLDSVASIHTDHTRSLKALFKNSSIKKRHSVFRDLGKQNDHLNFRTLASLPTKERNDLYRTYAPRMFLSAAEALIRRLDGFDKSEITHVVTASCTGCYSPGPTDDLVKMLSLNLKVERLHIGYMGCYAGLAMVRLANSIAKSDPNAVVLLVAAEISSLHWNNNSSEDNLLSISLFSDGSAAAIISQKKYGQGFVVSAVGSSLIPDTGDQMAWNLGALGFEMTLSRNVPGIIGSHVHELVSSTLNSHHLHISDIAHWAVHPGGAKILEVIEKNLSLDKTPISASWTVLNNYGNMSSATIFFVLNEVAKQGKEGAHVFALAFGPGLTIEKVLLSICD